MKKIALVRYGKFPETARFDLPGELTARRGDNVVVNTHRGEELGTVLEVITEQPTSEPTNNGNGKINEDQNRNSDGADSEDTAENPRQVVRHPTADDFQKTTAYQTELENEFTAWEDRIAQWKVKLQLIEIEKTLDGEKTILYVLNDRGPECTKLALQAATAGFGHIEVQPVGLEGLVPVESASGGGCGCGSGGGCH